jgi:hypothetical protein
MMRNIELKILSWKCGTQSLFMRLMRGYGNRNWWGFGMESAIDLEPTTRVRGDRDVAAAELRIAVTREPDIV